MISLVLYFCLRDMKDRIYKALIVILIAFDVITVLFPIDEIYMGTVTASGAALTFILQYGWISAVVNIVVVSLFFIFAKAGFLIRVACICAVLASFYYLITVH
jgi:hypothetical protein